MKLKLIACEVFYRELCAAIARSVNQVDLEFLPKGLHDIGKVGMLARLQEAVSRVDESKYAAILLGYGFCNYGLAGLRAGTIPLVIPRAHDCITLFLGSKERYLDYFNDHPGVYFQTSGWIERGKRLEEFSQLSITRKSGMDATYEELVEKYGEDNAKFLYAELCNHTRNYGQITFIEMGVEPGGQFEKQAQEAAAERGWKFEKVAGDLSLIQRLVDGRWDERDFLVVPAGWRVAVTYGDDLIKAEEVKA
ncbi:MAG: DUF1638 domain-containing protein [Planctomycetes bacterium]|nr:DUF1638 domain-containing protein [Planctomycetota bacterium]